MANYERKPSGRDERTFDGGEDEDEGEGSHLLVVIVIAIFVLAALGGVIWLAYNQGVAHGRLEVPLRVAGGEAGKAGQIKVYQQPAGPEEEAAAPAANPMPRIQPANPAGETPATAQNSPPLAALTPVKPMPAPPPAAAAKPPAQLSIAKPAPAAAAVPVTLKPSVAPTGVALQIGAYKSQVEAMTAWKTYRAKHSDLLSDFGPNVQKADLGAKGIWYRLRVTGFADKTAALALCEKLKAENGACFLAK